MQQASDGPQLSQLPEEGGKKRTESKLILLIFFRCGNRRAPIVWCIGGSKELFAKLINIFPTNAPLLPDQTLPSGLFGCLPLSLSLSFSPGTAVCDIIQRSTMKWKRTKKELENG
jgi:hypothetical protein